MTFQRWYKPVGAAFLSLLLAPLAAAELRLHIDKNRIGFVQAYLENAGAEPVTVPTAKLLYRSEGSLVRIVPERLEWQRKADTVLLKGSAADYALVALQPGEMTLLKNPNIRIVIKHIVYQVPEDWAALHGTWSGEAEVKLP